MKTLTFHKKLKKCILATLLIMLVGALAGCSPNPQNFTYDKLTVTLNQSFEERQASSIGLDYYLVSDDVSFSVKEETNDELESAGYEILTLADYSQQLFDLNGSKGTSLNKRDNYYYFITSSIQNNAKYTFVHCIYEGTNSYYICDFTCKSKDYKRLKEDIFAWADSIIIDK